MNNPIGDLIIGGIIVLFFLFKNPQKEYLGPVAFFMFLPFVLAALIPIVNLNYLLDFGLFGATGLIISFFLRFRKKPFKQFIDYMKWIGIFLIILYPAGMFDWGSFHNILYAINALTLPVLLSIYTYDRFILKPEQMKRRFVVILSIQTVLILLLFTYAVLQKLEADKNLMESIRQERMANESRKMAMREIEQLHIEIDSLRTQLGK